MWASVGERVREGRVLGSQSGSHRLSDDDCFGRHAECARNSHNIRIAVSKLGCSRVNFLVTVRASDFSRRFDNFSQCFPRNLRLVPVKKKKGKGKEEKSCKLNLINNEVVCVFSVCLGMAAIYHIARRRMPETSLE